MNLNNITILESCLAEYKNKHLPPSLQADEVFEIFCVSQITKDLDIELSEIENSIVDGGQDGGIDSFAIIVNDQYITTFEDLEEIRFNENSSLKIFITQTKSEKSITEEPFDKLSISLSLILDLAKDENELFKRFNSSLVEKILIFRKSWMSCSINNSKIDIIFSLFCKSNNLETNPQIDSKRGQIIEITRKCAVGATVRFDLYSSEQLLNLYRKQKVDRLTLKFRDNPISVKFAKDELGYIGLVNLTDYYNFIVDENKNIREHIFESNVRHFQGDIDVNKKIAASVEKDYTRDFWWLNNGVTIIASKCGVIPQELHLENVKIVNGLQTSFVIGKHFKPTDKKDERSILVKVIISQNDETIDKIISATNSQTAVSPSLLKATDELQRNLEVYFQSKGYYYDRRKNFYKNLNKPSQKIFSIQNATQAIESILFFNPSSARAKPTTLVKDDTSYTRIFNPQNDFKAYLNCCLIIKRSSEFIKNLQVHDKSILRNFTFHLGRITASVILNGHKYGPNQVATIDLDKINTSEFQKGYDILLTIVNLYRDINPEENIINIAKSNRFSKAIDDHLLSLFPIKSAGELSV